MDTKHCHRPAPAAARRLSLGLTLIEMVVALAITAILATAAAPSLRDFIDGRRLEAAAGSLAADVRFVRSEAAARQRPLRLSVQTSAASSCWIVHTGSAAQCQCGERGPAVCAGGASAIKTVVLPATDRVTVTSNVGSIVFDPMHGTSTPAGTLRLALANGRAIHHVVNVVGRVRSCSPDAPWPGYAAC